MPYYVNSPAGPWAQGQLVADKEFEAHPFQEKFLRLGAVSKGRGPNPDAAHREQKIAELQGQLAEVRNRAADLEAELATLQAANPADALALGLAPGQTITSGAPTHFEIDPANPPSAEDAAATRTAGDEVIQPQPGLPNLGEVVEDDKAKGGRK